MESFDLLKQIGLNEKEAAVYLALLELGTSTVHGIARKADLKRPTVYLILDNLEQKGLVSLIPKAKISLYAAQSPEKILTDLHKREQLLKLQLPNLLALYNDNKVKPQVQLFQGKEGVDEVYQKIFKARQTQLFSTIKDVQQVYPELVKELLRKTKQGEMRVKEILTKSKEDIDYAKSIQPNEYYEQRFAEGEVGFLTDNALFDDSVAFFSYTPFIFAVLITSKEIYQSLLTLFELAWQTAEPYEKVVGIKNNDIQENN